MPGLYLRLQYKAIQAARRFTTRSTLVNAYNWLHIVLQAKYSYISCHNRQQSPRQLFEDKIMKYPNTA